MEPCNILKDNGEHSIADKPNSIQHLRIYNQGLKLLAFEGSNWSS